MDSSTNHNYQQQINSGLSRFNSAPSMVQVNFRDSIDSGGVIKNSFESERLVSRFMNSGGDSGNINSRFQEFEVKSPVSYGNSQKSCSGLPPRPSPSVDSSYDLFMDLNTQVKTANSKLSAQNGCASINELGIYGGMNGSNGELSPSTTKRLKSQLSFPSSLGMLSQISEIESVSPGFQYGSWNDSSHLKESFIGMKREQGAQNRELGNSVHMLSHHLSLPKTSAEMAAVEKFLQFQDSVPCKIRAKSGFATHPRSIAERVRRTRISERMRKLQELVPNMDKQTSTADMLDLAVEYIKDLQNQFKTLSNSKAKCKCSRVHKAVPNQIVFKDSVPEK